MPRSGIFIARLGILSILLTLPAFAQNRANVTIDLGKAVNYLSDTSLGVPAPTHDGNSFNPAGAPYLRAAGISVARFPGNHGVADLYHWSTKTTTRYKGAEAGYFAPESSFPSFALFAEKIGQAVIVVNYGTNFDGDGGGEPAEAAAWVAYANGDAENVLALGKDASGEDWHTVGYWATIRGQAPLPSDDGLNFLRIQHPRPFGFKLWQIGDEVYNDGYYGGNHVGNPDLHGAAPTALKDFAKLKGDAKLSPSAYAQNLVAFAKAMKAVDPSIQIGSALSLPPDPNDRTKTYWDKDGQHNDPTAWAADQWSIDWDKNVLKGACASLDFATLEWSLNSLLPPDWKTLNEADLLANSNRQFSTIVSSMLTDYSTYCPKGHTLPLVFAPAEIASWPKVEHPVVKALWIADFYATLIESRTLNISWNEMYGDSMLSGDRKKFGPAYYGFQMLHIMAHNPGDALLDVSSSTSLVGAHATFRRDGFIGLMLVNKDPKATATVKVTFKNGTIGSTGKRIDYGSAQFGAGAPVAAAPFTATGNEIEIIVPPYTITDIILPRQN
ncbi:MAG: hypothetical protein ABR991_07310 [Terracidiphilus sp.]|jgi:hypothetical protein